MDVLELLKRIGLSDDELRYFTSGYLFRPSYYKQSNQILIPLKVREALPFLVWESITKKFESALQMEVILSIFCDENLAYSLDVSRYLSFYTTKFANAIFNNIYPKVEEDCVYLMLARQAENEQEERALDELAVFMKRIGVEPKYGQQQMPTPKAPSPNQASTFNTNSYSSESTSSRSWGFKRIDKEKCKYLPLSMIQSEVDAVYLEGAISNVDYRMTKKGTEIQTMTLAEKNDAFVVKRFENKSLTNEELHKVKNGQYVRCYGNIKYDSFSKELSMVVDELESIDPPAIRKDDAPVKRIELHAHTNRSEMDGVCHPGDLVKRAFKWGHKGIAITDHMVVQAFPEAQNTHIGLVRDLPEKRNTDFKVIYGTELNVANDQATIVYNPNNKTFKDATYVIFDLETTGLSSSYDHIIEFGAVKVHKGQEIGRMQQFVKPPIAIPPFIESKTNITNAMVKNSPTIEEVMPKILDFIKDTVLVAHNAEFDFGFMNIAMKRLGMDPLPNTVIDTLPLSWVLFPDRKRYTLGTLCHSYKIEYKEDDAHRADYDAEVLSYLFARLQKEFERQEVDESGHLVKIFAKSFEDMTSMELQNIQSRDIYKKIHAHHMNLLARNKQGIKEIYELITLSHTDYLTYSDKADDEGKIVATARIVRSEIEKRRENILVGSSCYNSDLFEIARNRSQKELEECMKFYDYIELQPLGNYERIVDNSTTFTDERLKDVMFNIIRTADKLGKIVVATSDSHYIDPDDKILRNIYINSLGNGGTRHPLYDRTHTKENPDQHLRTTQEMLDEFAFLGDRAYEIVVTNTIKVADMIERMFPLYEDLATPTIPGCEDLLAKEIYKTAHEKYGEELPEIVAARIEKELGSVTKYERGVQYYIAHLLVKRSRENGYVVGSRGSVGSSFIATMSNITEVNPLDPHYVCPNCHYSEFYTHGEFASGFDMPDKVCPTCGTIMRGDGHSIPFETFLGFKGDKVPDIDLNFSEEYQSKAQAQIKEVFGENNVFAAGTVQTVAEKNAVGYVKKYAEEYGLNFTRAKMEYLGKRCEGVKRTTGQHPGGIVVCPKEFEIHDFTPVQYPANNPNSEWKTTHFAIKDIHDNILKLDILGHRDPTAMKLLRVMSGKDPVTVPMNDQETMSLFSSTEALHIVDKSKPYYEETGAAGLPEFGTPFIRGILKKTRPTTFAELVSLSGLTHGTDVWLNNAADLIDNGTCTLKEVIGCRDDIMVYLILKGLDPQMAFKIMEFVRKGKWKNVSPEMVQSMRDHQVPEWYIESCSKIKYMFPKAHAVAYVMMAIRIAWYKVHMPEYYYAVYFTCRCDQYEISTMVAGEDAIWNRLNDIQNRLHSNDREVKKSVTTKEENLVTLFEVAYEMERRGYSFTNVDIERSDATKFIVDPTDNHKIIPPFVAIDGLGVAVAESVVRAREKEPFLSKEDLSRRTQLSGTHLQALEDMGALKNLQETNQFSLF